MRKEYEFLISVLKSDKNHALSLLDSVSFDRLAEIVKNNRLLPAFGYLVKNLGIADKIPFKELALVNYQRNLARNIALTKVFADISTQSKKKGVRILPLKGINLIENIYPNPAMRYLSDIDIYCPEAEFPGLQELLLAGGFTSARKKRANKKNFNHDFVKTEHWAESSIIVEVHTALAPPRPRRVTVDLFARTRHKNGLDYLGPEDLLLNMFFKIRRDTRELNLLYLYDIYMILTQEKNIDWQYVADQCAENGIERVGEFALYFLNDIFGRGGGPLKGMDYHTRFYRRWFTAEDFFCWPRYKGYILRACFFNNPAELAAYLVKKWP